MESRLSPTRRNEKPNTLSLLQRSSSSSINRKIPMVAGALLIYAVVTLLQQESTIDFDKYSITTTPSRIAVFYNVFALSDNAEYVKTIVKEQMSLLLPEHEFFVRSIGIPFNIPKTSLLKHDKEGDEAETLQLLWQHCNEHPNEKTVQIHSNGSLHNSDANNKLRRFLTRGAFQRNGTVRSSSGILFLC